jgi:cytochrome c oxidase cbb3-type subunit III
MSLPISSRVRPGEVISSLCAWLCVAAMLAGTGVRLEAQAETETPTKQYAPSDIQGGSRIYTAQCAACHGPNGDNVAKVDLRSGRFSRAASGDHLDDDLRKLISTGVPGTAMPPFKFDPAQLNMIVAYLRNMRDFNSKTVKLGDALRGQAIFETKGKCITCHRVNGGVNSKGSRVGPDLSDIGGNRTAEVLERSLLDPNASIQPANRFVRAVTRDGKTVRGRRLNEDTYTVQIIQIIGEQEREQERLVSLVKADLREYTVIKTSAMPSYKDTLSSDERADVIAYLLTLKGSQ